MDRTVAILGAGFSVAARLPTTAALLANFATALPTPSTPEWMQTEISAQLAKYWIAVFGWQRRRRTPSFEDHFTSLDLAANTGHHLGRLYSPQKLRAIRRMSLHRVFETLDLRFGQSESIQALVNRLAIGEGNAIVTTNWDIVVERHLKWGAHQFYYGIPTEDLITGTAHQNGIAVLKLHGSANWCYCDDCRRVFTSEDGKAAYKQWLFLEKRDFVALGAKAVAEHDEWESYPTGPKCPVCAVRLSARVATFSFDKALGFFQFQGIWEESLRRLRSADRWIFIGHSLPAADFELRQLLKTAQLAGRESRRLQIDVVLMGDTAAQKRFREFFGSRLMSLHTRGFEVWFEKEPGHAVV